MSAKVPVWSQTVPLLIVIVSQAHIAPHRNVAGTHRCFTPFASTHLL